jgi:hypothetical protein
VLSRWQIERGQLNHNWLQNGVLVALNHAVRIASGDVRSSVVRQALTEDIQRWDERRTEVPGFLERFENEMSPKVFFDRVPLFRCSDETKGWLIPLTHELWLRRETVREKIGKAKMVFAHANQVYETVHADLAKIPESPSIEDLKPFGRLLHEFTVACEALSKAISSLPHEIRCV